MTGIKVTILGCGGSAGVPQIGGADGRGDWGHCDPNEPRNRRLRSSILIESVVDQAVRRLLVDTSPDLRLQLTGCGVPSLDAVLYTHLHADHIAGFDELRIINRINQAPLDLYATTETLVQLRERFAYAFLPWKPPYFSHPVVNQHQIEYGETVSINGMDLRLFEQDHGYISSLGFRIGGFGYSTDVVTLDRRALDILHGVDVWVVDCFQRQPLKTHANPDQVREWIDIVKPKQVILTHMGYDMDWAWVKKNLAPQMEPAFDGMILEIAR